MRYFHYSLAIAKVSTSDNVMHLPSSRVEELSRRWETLFFLLSTMTNKVLKPNKGGGIGGGRRGGGTGPSHRFNKSGHWGSSVFRYLHIYQTPHLTVHLCVLNLTTYCCPFFRIPLCFDPVPNGKLTEPAAMILMFPTCLTPPCHQEVHLEDLARDLNHPFSNSN